MKQIISSTSFEVLAFFADSFKGSCVQTLPPPPLASKIFILINNKKKCNFNF